MAGAYLRCVNFTAWFGAALGKQKIVTTRTAKVQLKTRATALSSDPPFAAMCSRELISIGTGRPRPMSATPTAAWYVSFLNGFVNSSSPNVGDYVNAWYVSFNYGFVNYNGRGKLSAVRLVRASQ